MDLDIATKIISKILLFKSDDGKPISLSDADSECLSAVYSFCTLPSLEQSMRTPVLQLVRVDYVVEGTKPMETAWVYSALEQLWVAESQDIDVIGDLLQVLLHSRPLRDKPKPDALNTILWAMPSYPDHSRTQYFTYHLLCSSEKWFQDDQLWPLLQEKSIWTLLGKYDDWDLTPYISLGDTLSQTPEWKVILAQDYFGWFSKLPKILRNDDEEEQQIFCSVLSRVWDVDPTQINQFKKEEKILATAFTVLAKLWDQFNFPDTQDIQDLLRLIQCTLRTAFCTQCIPDLWLLRPSQDFRNIIVVCLGEAMSQAADQIKATNALAGDVEGRGVEILSKLVVIINGELRTRPTPDNIFDKEEIQYWTDLKRNFEEEIDSVHQLLENQPLVTANVQVESPME
ncbi:hypothetical protein C8R44DRAFT_355753 [Mycena epipterygia]|nr:hypothetical protein C8R44DRAFT_355753 [Mycena epipterygia]